jgi:hypothetical protein
MKNQIQNDLYRASAVLLCLIAQSALAQSAKLATDPMPLNTAPSQLDMPLVSAEQGQRFQQQRTVKTSDVPVRKMLEAEATTSITTAKPSLAGVNGEVVTPPQTKPTLGHVLPTSTTTPLGFPRADFAVGKPETTSQSVKAGTPSSATGLSNTVVK